VPGIFRAGRILEAHGPTARHFRLTQVLERGEDFERIAYE